MLDRLIAYMDNAGYDRDADDQVFEPRPGGPMGGGLVLSVQAAQEKISPGLADRSDEPRG